MPARANWKGYLKLSLVSCAVALYPATSSSSRVRFNTLVRATGNRVKRVYVDSDTLQEVDSDELVKGYAVGKNDYITVEDEELDAIKIESTHTIDIESFVPRDEVDERYLEAPYYIAPEDKVSQEAFAVIRDAMAKKGRAAIGRVVISRRERMVLLEALGKGIVATVLRYPYEVRGEESYFEDIPDMKLPPEMTDLANHIIESKASSFDPTKFEDRYEDAVIALIKSKQDKKPVRRTKSEPETPRNVVSLMDALKRSIAAEKAAPAAKAPSKKVSGRATVPAGRGGKRKAS